MGLYTPNILLAIGDAGHWSQTYRGPTMVADSRMREAYISSGNGSIGTDQVLYFSETPIYFEIERTGSTGGTVVWDGGVWGTINPAASYNTRGRMIAASIVYSNDTIWKDGSQVQTGVGSIGINQRLGIRIREVTGTRLVQFYIQGVAIGTEVTMTPSQLSVRGIFSSTSNAYRGFLHLDRDDILFMPDGCMAAGAHIRASDTGGYSNEASKLTSTAASSTIDEYGRALSASANNRVARLNKYWPTTVSDLIQFEAEIEVLPTAGHTIGIGMQLDTTGLTSVLGSVAGSAGFYWTTGANANRRINAASAVAIVGAGSWTTATRLGWIYRPSTGHVWLSVNGVVTSGDPLAGTGAVMTLTAGNWFPVVQTGTGGTIRIYTHTAEQKYLYSGARGFERTSVIPELHFKGTILSDTEITEGVWYEIPWGPGGSDSGIGVIEVDNMGKYYSSLYDAALKGANIQIWEQTTYWETIGKAKVSTVDFNFEESLRINSVGPEQYLKERNMLDLDNIGIIYMGPALKEQTGVANQYTINKRNPLNSFTGPAWIAYDQGLVVTGTTTLISTAAGYGINRTVAPAGIHKVTYVGSDAGAGGWDHTGLINQILDRAGFPTPYVNTLASTGDYVGKFFPQAQSYYSALKMILTATIGSHYTDPEGVLQFRNIRNLTAVSSTAIIPESKCHGPAQIRQDNAPGLTNRFTFDHIESKYQQSELADAVSPINAARWTRDYNVHEDTTSVINSAYAHAIGAAPLLTYVNSLAVFTTLTSGQANMIASYSKVRSFIERDMDLSVIRNVRANVGVTLEFDEFPGGRIAVLVRKTRRILSQVASCLFWS